MPFPLLKNDNFLRAARGESTPFVPVWLMRQAGRYLPEYRATRSKAGSFLALAKNPAYATEVTLQPLGRYPLDAAILFSDILTVPDAMGLGLAFENGEGPCFARPLQDEASIRALCVPDMESLRYVFDAVHSIRMALNGRVPLIGFSGSPFTLACYMIEGRGSDDFARTKKMLYGRPDLMAHILEINQQTITEYLNLQVTSGAQALMIFDTWGGALTEDAYLRCSLAPMQKIVSALKARHPDIPLITFTKGGGAWLHHSTGAQVRGLDWGLSLGRARRLFAQETAPPLALQGNFDPHILSAGDLAINTEVARIANDWKTGDVANAPSGWIFNLGHGISQFTPPEAVATLVNAVHQIKC